MDTKLIHENNSVAEELKKKLKEKDKSPLIVPKKQIIMDIRSLRIGDIVTTNGIPAGSKRGDFYRIIEIDSKDNFTDKKGVKHIGNVSLESVEDKYAYIGGAWVDYLEPIPITDELLKKNGLRLKESSGGMIKYLHELQHKMFDAGIESEIKI